MTHCFQNGDETKEQAVQAAKTIVKYITILLLLAALATVLIVAT